MSTNLYVTGAGAAARLAELEVLANNLANGDTVGFKGRSPMFAAMLEATWRSVRGILEAGA